MKRSIGLGLFLLLICFIPAKHYTALAQSVPRSHELALEHVVRGAVWLHSEEARIMARLITGIYGDKKLQSKFRERFLLPRRLQQLVIGEAISCGDLAQYTDLNLLIEALYRPLFYRGRLGHADPDEEFAGALVDKVLRAFAFPKAV